MEPFDRIAAIRAAVLFFSVMISVRMEGAAQPRRALFNGLAENGPQAEATARARERGVWRSGSKRDAPESSRGQRIGRGKLAPHVSGPRFVPEAYYRSCKSTVG